MTAPGDLLDLVDWRRRVFALYQQIRSSADPKSAWDLWRQTRDRMFAVHSQSPIPPGEREAFKVTGGLSYFDYDPSARVLAGIEPVDRTTVVIMGSEGQFDLTRFAKASFSLYGKPQTLYLHWFETYGGGVFVSFRDGTSGHSTYGACRYLLDTVKGADLGMKDGELVLDFNFSYQPSCSYDPSWVCPLAPPGNRLALAIHAGERLRIADINGK
jgi:uncharacterized protein